MVVGGFVVWLLEFIVGIVVEHWVVVELVDWTFLMWTDWFVLWLDWVVRYWEVVELVDWTIVLGTDLFVGCSGAVVVDWILVCGWSDLLNFGLL